MDFKGNCENGSFLDGNYNGTVNGFLINPEFYSNQLNILQRIVYGILFSFLSCTAIIGNSLALFTICNRKVHVLYRCCVVSQCLADILTAVFVGLNALSNFIQDVITWEFGDFMCGWIPYVTTASALLSSVILTCIAIDRYQGVVLLSGKWEPKFSTAIVIIGCIWLTAGGITVPVYLGYNEIPVCFINFETNTSFYGHLCFANRTISNYYFFTIFVLIFLPLLIAFTVLYSVIARMMWLKRANDKAVPGSTSALETNVSAQEGSQGFEGKPKRCRTARKVRTFKIILVILATFIICRLPQWIFIVVTTLPWIRLWGNFWWNVKYLLSALSLANSAINPFIYSFLNEVVNLKSNLSFGLKKFRLERLRLNFLSLNGKSTSQ